MFAQNRSKLIDSSNPRVAALQQEDLARLEKFNEDNGVGGDSFRELIDKAFLDGEKRGPHQCDVCVHAGWPFDERTQGILSFKATNALVPVAFCLGADEVRADEVQALVGKWQSDYRKRIEEAMRHASHGFRLAYAAEGNQVACPFPAAMSKAIGNGCEEGFLPPDALPVFLEANQGLHLQDTMRVHGASYGQCVHSAAQQLSLLHHVGLFMPSEVPAVSEDMHLSFYRLFGIQMLRGAVTSRLGVVFDTQMPYDVRESDCSIIDSRTCIIPPAVRL